MVAQSHRSMPINIPSTATPRPNPGLNWPSDKQAQFAGAKNAQTEDHLTTVMSNVESIDKKDKSEYHLSMLSVWHLYRGVPTERYNSIRLP